MIPLIIMGGPVLISTTTGELAIVAATYVVSQCVKSHKKKTNPKVS